MREQLAQLPQYLGAHVRLTLVALLAGVLTSVPLGVLVARKRWLESPVREIAGTIQTIPSLALLAMMVPLLAAVGAESIGFVPALIALSLYSLLPILATTVTGLRGVDPAMIEAARGVGMTPWQELTRVELPLAMPVIVTGIRTAAVWTVGTATLSTPVGATSLGNYIFSGLQTRNDAAILVGCTAAAALALVLDRTIRGLEEGIRAGRRRRVIASLVMLVVLYGYAGVSGAQALGGAGEPTIRIGAKTFTEQYILSEVMAEQLRRRGAPPAELVQSLGSSVAFDALARGDIDVYVDYSGTLWTNVMKRSDRPSRERVLEELEVFLRDEHGVTVIGTLGFENSYALAMRRSDADSRRIDAISDLAPHAASLVIGGDYEFFERPEFSALVDVYGLAFRDQRSMDPSLMYEAAARGQVDVISAFSTDGRIDALDLVVLTDDRGAIPPYDAVILAGDRFARRHPVAVEALRDLSGKLDGASMRRLNREVDEGGRSASDVAKSFLRELEQGS